MAKIRQRRCELAVTELFCFNKDWIQQPWLQLFSNRPPQKSWHVIYSGIERPLGIRQPFAQVSMRPANEEELISKHGIHMGSQNGSGNWIEKSRNLKLRTFDDHHHH